MPNVVVEAIDHRKRPIAMRIHAIQLAAYAQEAKLLGTADFPPLSRSVADVETSAERFFGASLRGVLLGVVAVEVSQASGMVCVSSLVVTPEAQRSGIGSALVCEVLRQFPSQSLVVSTSAANTPALALYKQFGFVVRGRRFAGPIELVKLRRQNSNYSMERTRASRSDPRVSARQRRLARAAHADRWAH